MTYEEAEKELTRIVEQLERGDAGLDEALKLWERGEELYRFCSQQLDAADDGRDGRQHRLGDRRAPGLRHPAGPGLSGAPVRPGQRARHVHPASFGDHRSEDRGSVHPAPQPLAESLAPRSAICALSSSQRAIPIAQDRVAILFGHNATGKTTVLETLHARLGRGTKLFRLCHTHHTTSSLKVLFGKRAARSPFTKASGIRSSNPTSNRSRISRTRVFSSAKAAPAHSAAFPSATIDAS